MNDLKPTHYAFSDESGHNQGRYRSIGMVSMPINEQETIERNFLDIISSHGKKIERFKWAKVKTGDMQNAISDVINLVFENITTNKLRIDVLIWDIEDSRHNILHRNDSSNLARMYYHLFKNVLERRWETQSIWELYPDQNTAIDWNLLEDILHIKGIQTEKRNSILGFKMYNRTLQIKESSTSKSPLIQLADIFAGMGRYSWTNYEEFKEWERIKSGQTFLIQPENTKNLSRRDKHRCPLLKEIYNSCKSQQFQLSLSSTKGLYSNNPQKPVNFWLYKPQSENDRAPTD